MSKRTKIILISIAVLVVIIAAYFIFRKKKTQEPPAQDLDPNNTLSTVTNPLAGAPKWIQNKFPLDVNMKGDYVFALQAALNRIQPTNKVPEDGIFGPATKNKLLLTVSRTQSVLPMSSATWQQIIMDSHK